MVIKNFSKFKNLVFSSQPVFVLFLEVLIGLLFCISLSVLFLKLSLEVFDQDFLSYDTFISQFVYLFRNPVLTDIMVVITTLGGSYVLTFLALITIILTWKKHRQESYLFLIIAGMGVVLNFVLKILIHRPRPLISPLIIESSYSYPSGHAMNSFIFYTTLAYFFYHFTKKRNLSTVFTVFFILLIGLIGFSRVYLGVHYPSDVLAGFIVGLLWFVLVLLFEKTISLFRLFKGHSR